MRTPLLLAALLSACGAATSPAAGPAPATTGTETPSPPRAPEVLFSLSLYSDELQRSVLYVVLDETRGAGGAATVERSDLDDGAGTMRVAVREVDVAALGLVVPTEVIAPGSDCRGGLGPVVELTLHDLHDEPDHEILATVLAAPLLTPCDAEPAPVLVYVAGTRPPQTFLHDEDAEVEAATAAEAAALLRSLPEDAELQAYFDEGREGEPPQRWEAEAETTFRVLRDVGGRELIEILVSEGVYSMMALVERVDGALVVRALTTGAGIRAASLGPAFDLEGDGLIELVERTGLVRDGALVRPFERAPFEPGC